jgi:hypothetical protein
VLPCQAMVEQTSPRWLLPAELAALAACTLAPAGLALPVPVAVPLLAIAAVSVAARRATFLSPPGPGALEGILLGALAGLVGLVAAVTLATPVLQDGFGLMVRWGQSPAVRGSLDAAIGVALVTGALATAQELIFRRWILERAYSLGASGSGSILIAGAAEALVGPGSFGARLGAALFGVALGMLYWRGGRRLGPALAARLAFTWGALSLQALRWIE